MERLKKFWSDHAEAIVVGIFTAGVVGFIGYKVSEGNKPYRVDVFSQPAGALKDAVLKAVVTNANGKTMHADLDYLGDVDTISHGLQAV